MFAKYFYLTTLSMHGLYWLQRGISTVTDNIDWVIHDLTIGKLPSYALPGVRLHVRVIWMGIIYWKTWFRKHHSLRNVLLFFFSQKFQWKIDDTYVASFWFQQGRRSYCHPQWATSRRHWTHTQGLREWRGFPRKMFSAIKEQVAFSASSNLPQVYSRPKGRVPGSPYQRPSRLPVGLEGREGKKNKAGQQFRGSRVAEAISSSFPSSSPPRKPQAREKMRLGGFRLGHIHFQQGGRDVEGSWRLGLSLRHLQLPGAAVGHSLVITDSGLRICFYCNT